jgi:hypothetical protein
MKKKTEDLRASTIESMSVEKESNPVKPNTIDNDKCVRQVYIYIYI